MSTYKYIDSIAYKGPIGLTDQDILTLRERYLEK